MGLIIIKRDNSYKMVSPKAVA